MLSVPTQDIRTARKNREMKALLADIDQHVADLRKGPLVIDVRGNGGGSSFGGQEIVGKIWGKAFEHATEHRLYGHVSVDWRVSPDNLAHLGEMLEYLKGEHDPAMAFEIKELSVLQQKMQSALAQGKPYVRESNDEEDTEKLPDNPVTGKVFFLTDTHCASACLDFADIVLQMPSVTQVGLPTYADTVYLEVDEKTLPGNMVVLGYPVKVYRGRKRGNNQWYTPKFRWPYDNPMTDDHKIISWIKTLK